jgi:hypothetical protein
MRSFYMIRRKNVETETVLGIRCKNCTQLNHNGDVVSFRLTLCFISENSDRISMEIGTGGVYAELVLIPVGQTEN